MNFATRIALVTCDSCKREYRISMIWHERTVKNIRRQLRREGWSCGPRLEGPDICPECSVVPVVTDTVRIMRAKALLQDFHDDWSNGCCLHIIVEDYNVTDDNIDFCLKLAIARNHPECEKFARALKPLNEAERLHVLGIREIRAIGKNGEFAIREKS